MNVVFGEQKEPSEEDLEIQRNIAETKAYDVVNDILHKAQEKLEQLENVKNNDRKNN